MKAFEYRCNKLLQKTAMNIGARVMEKEDAFDVWNDEQVFGAQDLALAYGEYAMVMMDSVFVNKIVNRENKYLMFLKDDSKEIITLLYTLSSLTKLQNHIGDFYENGYFSADHG